MRVYVVCNIDSGEVLHVIHADSPESVIDYLGEEYDFEVMYIQPHELITVIS